MVEKTTTPRIRFAGFTDPWEQRKLGDVLEVRNETGDQSNFDLDIELENLVSDAGVVVGDTSIRTQTDSVFRNGDTLFGRLRPYLNKWWHADRDGLKSGEIWAIHSPTLAPSFVYSLVQTSGFLTVANLGAGSKMPRSVWGTVAQTFVHVPGSAEEQKCVGEFMSSIDHLITLHQREYDKIVSFKKAMLEKMFPKNGEDRPEIRFAGFTDPWEQRKLGDLGKVLTGNTPPTAEKSNWSTDNNGYVWITPTDIKSLMMSNSERHLSEIGWEIARTVPANSVLITSIASIGKNTINTVPVAFNQQINAIVPDGSDAYFILTAMEKDAERFAGIAGQTATLIINKTGFENFTISTPTQSEQTAIGSLFDNLDHLITLHQRELVRLKNIKKSLLDGMFV